MSDAHSTDMADGAKCSPALLKKLNALLGEKADDVARLESARDQLRRRRDELERDLAISSEASDSALSRLLTRAQAAAARTETLRRAAEPLGRDCQAFVGAHRELCAALAPPLAAEEACLKERAYRGLLARLAQLSDAVRQPLARGATDDALAALRELHARTAAVVAESRCHALAEHARGLVAGWRAALLRRLTAALEAALAELRYPYISTNTAVHAAPPGPEAQGRLETALARLSVLSTCGEEPAPPRPAALAAFPPPSLPLRLLLRPLARRFVFHFHGQKRTNDPAKPEWYMGQVLQWITDHEQFLETAVEPVLARTLPSCRPRLEFCRGLVELAVEKLLRDLPQAQYDDATLSHTIDEALTLHRQLAQLGYGGSPEQPGPLAALALPGYLRRWVGMERKYALERLDQMLASETAWTVLGDQEAAVTEVADGVLTMLSAMTERYRLLPEPGQRLQFLDLQLELLDDLRVRLLQLLRNEAQEPLGARCCALLNTVHHLRRCLSEWGEQPAFLHLQFFRRRLEAAESALETAADGPEPATPTLSLDQVLSGDAVPAVAAAGAGPPEDDLGGLETTAFDASVQLFEKIETDIVQLIVDQILLEVLTQCLQQLRDQLSAATFSAVWRSLAAQLAEFLYDDLVMANKFNEGGAAQLQFDLDNLAAVFAAAAPAADGGPAAAEAEFRPLVAACRLLTLPTGTAVLLRETLREEPAAAGRALGEAGAAGLMPEEALEVLQRRTALSVL